MSELWHLFVEMTVQPEDFPSGDTVGFMNAIVRAASAQAAEARLQEYFAPFGWHIVDIENSKILSSDFIADDEEFADMLERARAASEAIVVGTFHSYKMN